MPINPAIEEKMKWYNNAIFDDHEDNIEHVDEGYKKFMQRLKKDFQDIYQLGVSDREKRIQEEGDSEIKVLLDAGHVFATDEELNAPTSSDTEIKPTI